MKKCFLTLAAAMFVCSLTAQQVSYDVPTTLSYFGTISRQEGIPFPSANYVTTNPINDGALIWVPVGSKVVFNNTSTAGATAYEWAAPGADMQNPAAENLIVSYNTAGTFDFPTLTASYAAGDKKYSAPYKIKVGGRAELCHSDTREWGKTYGLGHAPYSGNNGFLGGSNRVDIAGVGNFYKFSSPDMYVDGVNIYTAKQPSNYAAGAKVKLRIYLPYIGTDNFLMMGQFGSYGALELADIPMGDYKTRDDGAYLPSKDFGVYTYNIASPMNCEGYPYLFFAVEGFASKPGVDVTEDFVLLTDVLPGRILTSEEFSNALAHNSFVRQNSESDYMRPVSLYGGSAPVDIKAGTCRSYNFWICPLVRGAETPLSGIEDVISEEVETLAVEYTGANLIVRGAADGVVKIYGLNGVCDATATAANGGAIFNVSALQPGVYVVCSENGASVKFVK